MKISTDWLNEFVTLPKSTPALTDALTAIGHMLDKKEVKDGETILDLELRGNRADCYSVIGIAREVAAVFNTKVKYPPVLKLTKQKKFPNITLTVKTHLVKRAAMVEVYNIKICKSPPWLSNRLTSYGIEPVNNIVDLTNYVMLETGEPMHAFDLDKVKNNLEIRLARNNEKIITLQGTILALTSDDLVWANNQEVLSVAGAIGGKNHSISDKTKNVLLEAANYDQANIRRTVYRHNLLTDAGIRHEKELDPNLVEYALGRFLYLIQKNNWGKFKPQIYDFYPNPVNPWKIKLSLRYLRNLGGVQIDVKTIEKILLSLNLKIFDKGKDTIEVEIPTYRTDVTLEEDLIEEILRIYGYDKIPSRVLSQEIPVNITPSFILQENLLKNSAIACGFDEIISNSFVKEKYDKLNLKADNFGASKVSLVNPPSPDNRDLRQTLLPNLLENCQKIINERGESASLFEIGKTYSKVKNTYLEKRKIGFIYWEKDVNSYPKFKGLIEAFFNKANLARPNFDNEIFNLPLAYSYKILLQRKTIGFGGQIDNIFYTEIDLDSILEEIDKYKISLWLKFPPQIEDMTFTFPPKTRIGDVAKVIESTPLVRDYELSGTYESNFTFRIWYQHPAKTLTNEEVAEIRNKILQKIKRKFGGTLRSG